MKSIITTFLRIVGLAAVYRFIAALAINEAIPYYRPGKDITCKATVALTGKRFVAVTGNRTSGPGLASSDDPGVYQVGYPALGGLAFGVSGYDTPLGGLVPVKRSGILPVTAGAALAAGQEVMSDATGQAIVCTAGNYAMGRCMTAAALGADAEIDFYQSPSKR